MTEPRLRALLPSELDEMQRSLYDAVLGGPRKAGNLVADDGSLRGPFDPMLRSAEVGLPLQTLGGVLRFSTALDADLRELAIVLCAVEWNCPFELRVHRPLAESAGVPAELVDAIISGVPITWEEERFALVARAVNEVFRDHAVSEATFAALHQVLGERKVFELVTIFGYYATIAMILNSYGITE